MKIKKVMKQIKRRQNAVAKERDRLNDLISELSDQREDFDIAWENLQSARDALSKLV